MALAGGVNIITSPTLHQNLAAASFLNPNGSSKAFDAAAGGYCRGEGAGILVLKKLSRALADGDTVLGVAAGSAVNQGSNCSSITVPDSGSQCSLHRRVLSSARIEPKEVGYVEAHGTGKQSSLVTLFLGLNCTEIFFCRNSVGGPSRVRECAPSADRLWT